MAGKLNKRLFLILFKYGTWLIALGYFIQVIVCCFGIQSFIFSILFGISAFPIIIMCLLSYMLGFCIWHRLPLYYVCIIELIKAFDYYIGIPISNKWMLIIYLIIAGIFILVGIIKKNNYNVEERNTTKSSA